MIAPIVFDYQCSKQIKLKFKSKLKLMLPNFSRCISSTPYEMFCITMDHLSGIR
jgi:hypothetical protein